jgi:hypothetical protein
LAPNYTTISIREYATRKGCSEGAIRKAIMVGKIHKGLVFAKGAKRPSIIPEIADQEWSSNYNAVKSRNGKVSENLIANENPVSSQKQSSSKEVRGSIEKIDPNKITLAEAQRAKMIFETKIKQLEYEKTLGSLVDKEKVYKALFNKGQEDRNKFESIPDRCIDNIRAAKTRQKAYQILVNEIHEVLEATATIPKLT